MNRFQTLLMATILVIVCAAIPAVALAHKTSHHHRKHAHVTCTATAKSHASKSHAAKSHASKGQAGKGQAGKGHASNGQAGKGHASNGQAGKGHASNGQAGKGDASKSKAGKHHATHTAKGARKCSRWATHSSHQPSSHQASSRGHQVSSEQTGQPKETTVSGAPSDAATIARVLGATCENTELMPEAGNLETVAQATLCLVNQERARNGVLPLQVNSDLTEAAEGHSAEMVEDDYFAHVSPSGETPFQRIEASGYIPNSRVGYTLGENIAWGTLYLATPKAIVAAWIASPEHLANILNAAYTETGMGIAPQAPAALAEGQAGAIYSQEFGVIEA